MPSIRNIVSIAFLGATLLLLLPPFFLIGVSTSREWIEVLFQFLLGWLVLGILLYGQARLLLHYQNWWTVAGLSLLLLILLTGIDILLSGYFPRSGFGNHPPPIAVVPESITQNFVLYLVAGLYTYQYFQRRKREANQLQLVRLQKENLELQLNSLQQQLNPHFFFNSLNTLSELIYIDVEKSEAYIHELSEVFRYILAMQQKPLVSLEEEVRFIQSYFYLLKIRFEDKINLDQQLTQPQRWRLPSLSLLVLFENAIKHNAISASKPLRISMEEQEGYLSVRNNKHPLPGPKSASLGIGLENLKNRCRLLTQQECRIENEALFFTVKIPLLKNEEANTD